MAIDPCTSGRLGSVGELCHPEEGCTASLAGGSGILMNQNVNCLTLKVKAILDARAG